RGLAALLAGAGLALAAGAAAGSPAGLLLVAVAFGGFQAATVLADVRLQRRIEDSGRATLTSVAGLGTEVATITVFGGYALVAAHGDHGTAFTVFALPYLLTAVLLVLVRPSRSGRRVPWRGRRFPP